MSEAELRALLRRARNQLEEERSRLATELHNTFVQQLTVVRLELALLGRSLIAGPGPVAEPGYKKVKEIESIVDEMIKEVRRIQAELRPKVLDEFGIVAALEWEVRQCHLRNRLPCAIDCGNTEQVRLDPLLATGVFRLFHCALAGVVEWGRASEIDIELELEKSSFVITVMYQGLRWRRERAHEPSSLAWLEIVERAAEFGIEVSSAAPRDNTVVLEMRVPVEPGSRT
jgi:signal transduction histidine kinase